MNNPNLPFCCDSSKYMFTMTNTILLLWQLQIIFSMNNPIPSFLLRHLQIPVYHDKPYTFPFAMTAPNTCLPWQTPYLPFCYDSSKYMFTMTNPTVHFAMTAPNNILQWQTHYIPFCCDSSKDVFTMTQHCLLLWQLQWPFYYDRLKLPFCCDRSKDLFTLTESITLFCCDGPKMPFHHDRFQCHFAVINPKTIFQ